jgi:WD40 repeat protein
VWDAETGDAVAAPFQGHTGWITSVAFSPIGSHVVSGSCDNTVRVWDAETGQSMVGPFEGHRDWVTSVAFSPDGKRVVSGSRDHTMRVWDVQTGETVAGPFRGHIDGILSVTYSQDGKHVISGSCDTTVRVWDVETQETVVAFQGHAGWVTSVTYSFDGKYVISGSGDKTVRVWDVKTGEAVAGLFRGQTALVSNSNLHNTVDRHLKILHSIGGLNLFSTCHSRGWAFTVVQQSRLLFWVPHHARPGLCDGQSLFVLNVRQTQVDLTRFVHGSSWALCHHRPGNDGLNVNSNSMFLKHQTLLLHFMHYVHLYIFSYIVRFLRR